MFPIRFGSHDFPSRLATDSRETLVHSSLETTLGRYAGRVDNYHIGLYAPMVPGRIVATGGVQFGKWNLGSYSIGAVDLGPWGIRPGVDSPAEIMGLLGLDLLNEAGAMIDFRQGRIYTRSRQ